MRIVSAFAAIFGLMAAAQAAGGRTSEPVSILPGGGSKAPISVEADALDYFEKEGRAVYSGHVVAVQGDTKLSCSKLTILMEKSGTAPKPAGDSGGQAAANTGMRHMDCAGPVSVVSKTQTATGDSGAYDKAQNTVTLTGHVVLSDGANVTKGESLTYDLSTGQASMQGHGSRVRGLFVPGSADAHGGPGSK